MTYTDTATLLRQLSSRDLAILEDIEQFRLLTTRHVQQLHFRVSPSTHATIVGATRATTRVLNRLLEREVIDRLKRRIGGAHHGSQGFIWQLTTTGDRIQRYRRGEPGRRRYTEPSALFTDHTLAITGIAVALRTLAASGAVELLELTTEPKCWRDYFGPNGITETLKPDLFAVTATGEYEDHWFIEADQNTEHLPKILTKSAAYVRYAATGIEQARTGVFPAVLWVTPTSQRAEAISRAINGDPNLPSELFQTATTDHLATRLTGQSP